MATDEQSGDVTGLLSLEVMERSLDYRQVTMTNDDPI